MLEPGGPTGRPRFSGGASGYWMVGADGKVFPFGDAQHPGDASGALPPGVDAVDLEPSPSGNGYWIVDASGGVHAYGDAPDLGGSEASVLQRDEAVTSLSATPSGTGYWMFTTRGRVFPFGDARQYGDLSKVALNGPVLDSIPTATGEGYYMVASDGGIFAFEAPFRGSMGGTSLNRVVTGMVAFGNGYLIAAEDGGIFNFSDQPFSGSLGSNPPARPIVSVAALDAR